MKTSLNINSHILSIIAETSSKFNISQKEIIIRIFDHCHENFNYHNFKYGRLISYQQKTPDDIWKCFRINFNETQCDVYQFYRNQYKISLSKLLAIGFMLFFDRILQGLRSEKQKSNNFNIMHGYAELRKILLVIYNSFSEYFIIQPIPKGTHINHKEDV